MSDELERQLEAFGATLESTTGEPVRASDHGLVAHDRSRHRAWAIVGAAACLVAVVGGLLAMTGRDAEAPTAQPSLPTPTSTTIPILIEPEVVPTTTPRTVPSPVEIVPDDPLALERDGWALVQRTDEPFAAGEVPCEAAQGLADFDGVPSVHDILTSPDGTGLDLDVQVLDVGSTDRGTELAVAVLTVAECIDDSMGLEVETGAMSSVRATWFRAGPEFALVTIVGEGSRSIVLEVENAPFDDDLIGELVHRADQFLRGAPVSAEFTSDDDPPEPDRPEIVQRQMTVAEQQRFDDDETGGLVCDERGRGGTTWDWEPIGPGDVENRRPVDEFWAAIDDNVRDMQDEGGVPYPTDGWTELQRTDRESLFVLEVDGEPRAAITVTGDPTTGVWRRGTSAACQSLFLP